MSNRTLIELNHDFASHFNEYSSSKEILDNLTRFLRNCDKSAAENLERHGIKVIMTVHHKNLDNIKITVGCKDE